VTIQEQSILAAQPFMRGLPSDEIAVLAGMARHISLPARHRLFEEGSTADKFWLIDAGRVALDAMVPGHGRVVIETLGRGDVIGLSWLTPPYQWRFGAVTTAPMQAFELDGRAVREVCAADPVLCAELNRRFITVVVRRLQATRDRLVEACAHPELLP
jgi:CRP/FNR family transcriptional regulator, cyclic AMP receptor protein